MTSNLISNYCFIVALGIRNQGLNHPGGRKALGTQPPPYKLIAKIIPCLNPCSDIGDFNLHYIL